MRRRKKKSILSVSNIGLSFAGLLVFACLLSPSGAQTPLGMIIGDPVALNSNAAIDSGDDWEPQLTVDGAGNWVAVWYSYDSLGGTIATDADILVARSTDNGTSWSDAAALNTNATSDSGPDFDPQVATDGAGVWVAVWYSEENLGGTIGPDADILVARSTDNGQSWSAPAALNANAASDSGEDRFPQVTTDGAGNWVAVWYSLDSLVGTIGTDGDILVARSTDNGQNWSAPAALNTNAISDSGIDSFPQVTTDGAGNWVAVWQSTENLSGTIGTDDDILVARSMDSGMSWSAPAALNTDAVVDSGSDWSPQVMTDGAGNWVAVWRSDDDLGGSIGTDFDILVSRSADNGTSWSDPAALNTNAVSDSGDDHVPQVTTDGAGNWVAVWQSTENLSGMIGADEDILVAHSMDNGLSWSGPAALNTNAVSDSGADWTPQITTDGADAWVAVWRSEENLGGTIGTDYDMLSASSSISLSPTPAEGVLEAIAYLDIDSSNTVNGQDVLVMTFDKNLSYVQPDAVPGVFFIPVVGDSLGVSATMELSAFNPRQVLVGLGTSPVLTIPGTFYLSQTSPGSPSGLDISASMAGAIQDVSGVDVEDLGVIDVDDTAADLLFAVEKQQSTINVATGGIIGVGPNGFYNKHRLEVPAGATVADTIFTLESAGLNNISAVTLSPATAIIAPVTITLEYKDFDVNWADGYIEEGMAVHEWNASTKTWQLLGGTHYINKVNRTVSAVLVPPATGINPPNTWGNVGIPTVKANSGSFDPDTSGKPLLGTVTLSSGSPAVYTNHRLDIRDYQAGSAITISLAQAALAERHGYGYDPASGKYIHHAIMKITTTGETSGEDRLTMEYKDDSDPSYTSDVPSGHTESSLRIHYWDSTASSWVQVPGRQTVDTGNNTVTATVQNLTAAQLYSVQPGPTGIGEWEQSYK